jgi:hypothetical protein
LNIQVKLNECLTELCLKITADKMEEYGLTKSKGSESWLPDFYYMKLVITKLIPSVVLVLNKAHQARELFKFANALISKTNVSKFLANITPVTTLCEQITGMIRLRPVIETSAQQEDYVLGGLLSFLCNLLAQSPKAKKEFSAKNKLIAYLVHECLFIREVKNSGTD